MNNQQRQISYTHRKYQVCGWGIPLPEVCPWADEDHTCLHFLNENHLHAGKPGQVLAFLALSEVKYSTFESNLREFE